MKIFVRAIQEGWVMGDDLEIADLNGKEKIRDVLTTINAEKGIPVSRQSLRILGGPKIGQHQLDWSLNRAGFYDGSIIELNPATPGSWAWHEPRWYEQRLLEEVLAILRSPYARQVDGGANNTGGAGGFCGSGRSGGSGVSGDLSSGGGGEAGRGSAPLAAVTSSCRLPPPLARYGSLRQFLRCFPDYVHLELDCTEQHWTVSDNVGKHRLPCFV